MYLTICKRVGCFPYPTTCWHEHDCFAGISTLFLSLPPMFLTSGATLFHPSPSCHYPFLFDRPWSYKDVGDLGESGSMTWKIHEASVASHLRDGITGIYLVLTCHTPRKFKPCFSDNVIQHGIVFSMNKAMHGIYATWVTQTYLCGCCLCYTSGSQILSPLVCINYLLYPYPHYIGSDLLHVHDRTFCFNLVSKHAGYFIYIACFEDVSEIWI